jgi:chemotaxis protein MotB
VSARRKRRDTAAAPKAEGAGGMRWLLTYSDMITLLLCFFIIMYALSSVQKYKYEALVQALRAAFNGKQITVTKIQDHKRAPEKLHTQATINPSLRDEKLYRQLKAAIAAMHDQGKIVLYRLPYGIDMVFLQGILFQEGRASLNAAADHPLTVIGNIIERVPNALVIQGFTDSLPIDTPEYHSNWDLSAVRAARVADYWTAAGISPHRMMLEGFGQWSPFASNSTPAGRAQNRAVSVVILNHALTLRDTAIGSPTSLFLEGSTPR